MLSEVNDFTDHRIVWTRHTSFYLLLYIYCRSKSNQRLVMYSEDALIVKTLAKTTIPHKTWITNIADWGYPPLIKNGKPLPFITVTFLKKPMSGKTVKHKVKILGGKIKARRTKDTQNMTCKLTTNKCKNICVGFYWNEVCVSGWKLSEWSNDTQCLMDSQREDLVRNRCSLTALPSFARPHILPYDGMTASISYTQSCTQDLFYLSKKGVMMTYTRYFHTKCSIGINISPAHVFIFLNQMNRQYVYITMVSDHTNA